MLEISRSHVRICGPPLEQKKICEALNPLKPYCLAFLGQIWTPGRPLPTRYRPFKRPLSGYDEVLLMTLTRRPQSSQNRESFDVSKPEITPATESMDEELEKEIERAKKSADKRGAAKRKAIEWLPFKPIFPFGIERFMSS